jgi:hypothetical protein
LSQFGEAEKSRLAIAVVAQVGPKEHVAVAIEAVLVAIVGRAGAGDHPALVNDAAGGQTKSLLLGEEKGIDVRLAIDVIGLAYRQEYDVAIIFNQDQDLSDAAHEVRPKADLPPNNSTNVIPRKGTAEASRGLLDTGTGEPGSMADGRNPCLAAGSFRRCDLVLSAPWRLAQARGPLATTNYRPTEVNNLRRWFPN